MVGLQELVATLAEDDVLFPQEKKTINALVK